MQFILIAFLIIKPHIQPCCGPMKGPYTHWISSRAGTFTWQSKYTEVFSNNVGLPTTTLLFIYVFIWISCILVEVLGTAGCAIWGPFDKSWLPLTRLHHFALRLGYLSWGFIMMLLSEFLRPLYLLGRLPPFIGCWAWQVPFGALTRNIAQEELLFLGSFVCIYSKCLQCAGHVIYLC